MTNKIVKVDLGPKTANSIVYAQIKGDYGNGYLVIKGIEVIKSNIDETLLEMILKFDIVIEKTQIIG